VLARQSSAQGGGSSERGRRAEGADVGIDGQPVGDTPLGDLAVSIGAHDIVFKHPELGEKRVAVTVTLAGPARVSVEMGSR
jgi:hypothetical protein